MSPRKPASNQRSELALVAAVVAGDAEAAQRFVETMSATLWSVVVKLEGGGAEGEAAFLHVIARLKADAYARLRAFDGRSRFSTFLALVARDILLERHAGRFSEDPHDAWHRFVRYFEHDIRRRAARRFPRDAGTAVLDDVYQEVCLKLVEDDFRRIRSYGGYGSFAGYVLTIVDRILIDLVRRDAPRRRLPAAVARLPPLDREVYAAIAWEGCPADRGRLAEMLRGRLEQDPDASDIDQALGRIAATVRLEATTPSRRGESVSLDSVVLALADPSPTPEDHLLLAEEERSRGALVAAVKAAAAELPPDERLYIQVVFSATDPVPAREIARLMGCPVKDVYRLKQRAQGWIADIAAKLKTAQSVRLSQRTNKL